MAQENIKYPIDTQTFSTIRENGFAYIDKTGYVYNMTHSNMRYVFLSRPRRFGKSLLVSTLKSYFEGDRDLFKGLAIEKLETEWEEYPVLLFDMSTAKHVDERRLESELSLKLSKYEKIYGRNENEIESNQRLMGLIERAYNKTKKKVVVLIDEYDAPLLDVVHEEENLTKLRNVMRNFYSPLKACDPYLRFVFITGITKFSQLSIFSELNNIKNISMNEEYAAICGITEEEMLSQMPEGIERIAKKQGLTNEETLRLVKAMYDGYHFTWPSPDIYNPYSLVNAFSDGKLDSYWFGTGTPTYLLNMMNKFGISAGDLQDIPPCEPEAFDTPTEQLTNIIPLFYQSGYFTIKGYDVDYDAYILDIPNREIRVGLYKSLIPNYTGFTNPESASLIRVITKALKDDRLNDALTGMQTFFSAIPYLAGANTEAEFQRELCTLMFVCGASPRLEERTAAGRIDMVYESRRNIYVIELKLDRSAQEALDQINERGYADSYALDGRPVVQVGINFSTATRNIDDWKIA